MARSEEEADYGGLTERDDMDSEESDGYTYETYSEESDDTEYAPHATSKRQARPRTDSAPSKLVRRSNEETHQKDYAPYATSKRQARPRTDSAPSTVVGRSNEETHQKYAEANRDDRTLDNHAINLAQARHKVLLRPNEEIQQEEAQANRKDSTRENRARNLTEFLQYIVLHTCPADREQSGSSTSHSEPPGLCASPRSWATQSPLFDESAWKHTGIPCSVFEDLLGEGTDCNVIFDSMYDDAELVMHKQMWDLMKYDKCGKLKNNNFVEWCRKVYELRQEYQEHKKQNEEIASANATEHWQKRRADHATEHGKETHKDKAVRECTEWYHNWLAKDMLENETTPEQQTEAAFKFKPGKATQRQRSWMNTMLRKNMGHAKTPFFIFHHGLPRLLQSPTSNSMAPTALEFAELFADFVKWHASLVISLVEHKESSIANYNRQVAHHNWREHRKEEAARTKQMITEAFCKVKGKTPSEPWSQAEWRLLKDLTSDQTETNYAAAKPKLPPPFIGDIWSPA